MAATEPPQLTPEQLAQDDGWKDVVASAISISFSVIFLSLRLLSRWLKKSPINWSDYTLIAGAVLAWAIMALIIWGTTQGLGRRIAANAVEDPTLAGPQRFLQGLVAVECLYVVSLALIKISFLIMYRDLFPGKPFRNLTYVIGSIIVAWTIAVFFISIFACSPISAFWTFSEMPTAKCIDQVQFYVGIWVPNIVTDLIIIALPQFKVWKLKMRLRNKIAVAVMFLLGGFVIIASIIRFTTLFKVDPLDYTWTLTTLGIWTPVELAAAVASASMPTMRPIMHKLFRETSLSKITGGRNSRHTYNKEQLLGLDTIGGTSRRRDNFDVIEDAEEASSGDSVSSVKRPRDAHLNHGRGIVVTKSWHAEVGPRRI